MKTYVFIDSRVADFDSILRSLAADVAAVILDPLQDGVAQIAQTLARASDVDAIHIVSHGADGVLHLGDGVLDSSNLARYTSELQSIGAALSDDGDILLYGCEVAASPVGEQFARQLAALTDADVAASTDRTGAAMLGGDAVLESATGMIETQTLDLSDYSGVLAPNTAPTFLIGSGKLKTDVGATSDIARDAMIQSDGKSVVVGDSNGQVVVTRYNTDGNLDTSFSGDGKAFGPVGISSGVALMADGRIVASYSSGGDFQLARFSTAGVLETTVTVDFGGTDQVNDVMVLSDGRILLAGTSNGDVALARLTTGFTLDNSFDGDGRLTTNVANADEGTSVAIQADGKILVAGSASLGAGANFAVARYNTNGTLDTAFNGTGKVIANFFGEDRATSIALQADGKIVLGGYTSAGVGGSEDFALARFNTDGSPDATFNSDGQVTTNFGNQDRVNSIVIQSDGKIVAAGSWDGGSSDFAIARYNVDGTLDTTFSGDGLLNLTFGTTFFGQAEFATSVKLQADGKLLVVGYTNSNTTLGENDFALARINTNGTLDTTFSKDAKVTTDIGGSADVARDSVIQSDGKLIVAGSFGGSMALTRYNTDGTLDTSFSGDGKAFGALGAAYGVALQAADGKIVIGGDNSGSLVLSRFNTDGNIDTTFGTGGTKTVTMEGFTLQGRDLLGQSDGNIVLVGAIGSQWRTMVFDSVGTETSSNTTGWAGPSVANAIERQLDGKYLLAGSVPGASGSDFGVARYFSGGIIDLDISFDTDGRQTIDFGGADVANAIALQSDGKIVVAGYTSFGDDFALARLNTNGTLDATFDGDGKVTTNFGNNDRANSVVIQSDGKIIAAGSWDGGSSDFAIARYNTNGSLDTTFDGDGRVSFNFGTTFFGDAEFATSVKLQADGKIVVSGYTNSNTTNGDNDFAIARLNTNGSLDTTFNISVNTLGGVAGFTEHSVTPVFIDNSVIITDAELAATHYSGATLTLARQGGANAQDVFSAAGGALSALTEGNALVLSGVIIGGVVQNSGGLLSLSFNTNATQARVNQALSSLAYLNTSSNPAAQVKLDWTFNDGNTGGQGTGGALSTVGSTTINVALINDAPTAPANATTYTNPGTTYTFALADFGFSDAEDVNLTAVRIDTIPATGNLRFDGFNVTSTGVEFTAADILAGRLTFAAGASGGSFQYKVKDGGALFNSALSVMNVVTSGEIWNGGPGDDTHIGTPFADSLNGLGGNDLILGVAGNDILDGGVGNDTLDGGAGADTADYTTATSGVVAELWRSLAVNDGQGGSDTLTGIENLTGSALSDVLAGDNNSNLFKGGAGNDALYGGGGIDTVDYSDATGSVRAELWQFFASNDGQGGADTLVDVENLTGTAFADILAGDNNRNVFKGGAGNDAIFGGSGSDTADYSGATGGVFAELWRQAAGNDGQGGSDVLVDIENLSGSAFADTFAGDNNDNLFTGGAGSDALFGGGGTDTADYSGATSGVFVELWQFFASNDGQGGADSLVDIENLTGSAFSDTFAGDNNNNSFKGGAGNDAIFGGGGIDTADYSGATSGVFVEIWKFFASNDGQGGADTLVDIENVNGSAFADTFAGDNNNNVFKGGAGVDAIFGGGGIDTADYSGAASGTFVELWRFFASNDGQGGADTLVDIENLTGSAFNDTFAGDNNNNVFKGGAGVDALFGGGGIDTISYADASSGVHVELWQFFASNDGQGGADTLVDMENVTGSAFADVLAGDNNANRLEGAGGTDVLYGGGGADSYAYGAGSGVDYIGDFIKAQGDKIHLQSNLNGSGITTGAQTLSQTSDVGGNAVVDLGGGNSVTLVGISTATLAASDFVIF